MDDVENGDSHDRSNQKEGRVADAIDHYRRARDEWPETFYGAQADWFLRVAEQTERLEGAEVVRNRG